jgi:flavin reductase (DIM6/NTAB) family NADH-FMN oxidoreductase RutF
MKKSKLPLSRVYGLLEPGPVVLMTTARGGRANIMALSWHTVMEFEPPLVGCVVSGRNYSYDALETTKECVLNIPTADLAEKVVGCGNTSGRDIDKFQAFGLTAEPASTFSAPLIAECFASLECKVVDTQLVAGYNFFVMEVQKAWVTPSKKTPKTLHHLGRGRFMVAGKVIELASEKK